MVHRTDCPYGIRSPAANGNFHLFPGFIPYFTLHNLTIILGSNAARIAVIAVHIPQIDTAFQLESLLVHRHDAASRPPVRRNVYGFVDCPCYFSFSCRSSLSSRLADDTSGIASGGMH